MSNQDEPAVRDVIARWDAAWNAHDAAALTALHTDTAETINRFGKFIKGRADHEAQFAWLHSGPFRNVQSAPQKIFSVRFLSPDIATVRTIWETPELEVEGRTIPREDMLVSYLTVKHQGNWLIAGVDLHNVAAALGQPSALPVAG